MGRLERWSGDGVANGVGVPRGAAETRAMSLEEVADSGHLGGVGQHLRAEVDHTHQLVSSVLRLGTHGRVPSFELSKGAELGNANGVVVGVENGERHGAIFGDTGDGGVDEDI